MLSAIEHAPTVCTMRQDELLQFCQEVGYHCRLEPGGSLALPPDANVALTDWERSMRLRQGHFSVLDGEPWQGAGSSAEALDGAAAAAAAAAAAWAGGEADLAGDERVPAWLCSESSRDTGSAGDATLEEMRSWLEGCLLSSTFSAAADAAAAAAAAAAPAATAAPAPSSSSSPSGAPLAPAPAAASSPAPPAGAAVQQPAAASAAAAGAGDGEQPAAASTSNAAAALGAAAAAAAAGKQGNLPEGRTFREVAGSAKVRAPVCSLRCCLLPGLPAGQWVLLAASTGKMVAGVHPGAGQEMASSLCLPHTQAARCSQPAPPGTAPLHTPPLSPLHPSLSLPPGVQQLQGVFHRAPRLA